MGEGVGMGLAYRAGGGVGRGANSAGRLKKGH